AGSRTYEPARYVRRDRQRRPQGFDAGELAALDRRDCGVGVQRLVGLLEVLRLETATAPPAGRGAVEDKRPSHALVIVQPGQQGRDLAGRLLSAKAAESKELAGVAVEAVRQRLLHGALRQAADLAAVRRQVLDDPIPLVGGGDLASGESFDLSVDRRPLAQG